MRNDAGLHRSRLLLAFVLLPLVDVPCRAPARADPIAAQGTAVHMIGTVRVVDVEARTFELITAVGHAVRLLRMQVADDCRIEIPGAPPRLASLEPGACVRVEYVIGPAVPGVLAGGTAVAIEALEIERPGGAR